MSGVQTLQEENELLLFKPLKPWYFIIMASATYFNSVLQATIAKEIYFTF